MTITEFIKETFEDVKFSFPLHITPNPEDPNVKHENFVNAMTALADVKKNAQDRILIGTPIKMILLPALVFSSSWLVFSSPVIGIFMSILVMIISQIPNTFTIIKQIVCEFLNHYKDGKDIVDEKITINIVISGFVRSFIYLFPIAYSFICFLMYIIR